MCTTHKKTSSIHHDLFSKNSTTKMFGLFGCWLNGGWCCLKYSKRILHTNHVANWKTFYSAIRTLCTLWAVAWLRKVVQTQMKISFALPALELFRCWTVFGYWSWNYFIFLGKACRGLTDIKYHESGYHRNGGVDVVLFTEQILRIIRSKLKAS